MFDLPQIVVEVTEHQMLALTCGCGHTTRACAPAPAGGPTNLGDGISAVAVYLSTAQMIPIERVAATIEALFGISVSTGWVSLALERAKEALEPANEAIKKQITGSGTAFFDESMTKVCGKRAWFHAAATATLTAYHADAHGRGLGAMSAFGILDDFTGVGSTGRLVPHTSSSIRPFSSLPAEAYSLAYFFVISALAPIDNSPIRPAHHEGPSSRAKPS